MQVFQLLIVALERRVKYLGVIVDKKLLSNKNEGKNKTNFHSIWTVQTNLYLGKGTQASCGNGDICRIQLVALGYTYLLQTRSMGNSRLEGHRTLKEILRNLNPVLVMHIVSRILIYLFSKRNKFINELFKDHHKYRSRMQKLGNTSLFQYNP